MNDSLNEQISALADDELRPEERELLLRRLAQSPELNAHLGRYRLIGEAMRRDLPSVVDTDFATRLSARIAEEPAHNQQRPPQQSYQRLLRPVAGFAVAASVAVVTLALWPNQPTTPTGPAGVGTIVSAPTPEVQTGVQQVVEHESPARSWERLEPHVQQRLNGYLVNHSEHSSAVQFGSMLNYVRLAGHENEE